VAAAACPSSAAANSTNLAQLGRPPARPAPQTASGVAGAGGAAAALPPFFLGLLGSAGMPLGASRAAGASSAGRPFAAGFSATFSSGSCAQAGARRGPAGKPLLLPCCAYTSASLCRIDSIYAPSPWPALSAGSCAATPRYLRFALLCAAGARRLSMSSQGQGSVRAGARLQRRQLQVLGLRVVGQRLADVRLGAAGRAEFGHRRVQRGPPGPPDRRAHLARLVQQVAPHDHHIGPGIDLVRVRRRALLQMGQGWRLRKPANPCSCFSFNPQSLTHRSTPDPLAHILTLGKPAGPARRAAGGCGHCVRDHGEVTRRGRGAA